MVRAVYRAEDDVHTFTLIGHAGYAEKGSDIVCAGVSAIVQALMGWAIENPECYDCISTDEKSGEVIIACHGGKDVAAVFNMAAIGVSGIAESYPKHVQIEWI